MKGLYGCFCLVILCTVTSFGQTSVISGPWNETATWDCTCIPDYNSGTITISSLTTVTVPSGYVADADQVVVAEDGGLTIASGGELIIRDEVGDDLTIADGDDFFTFDGLVTVDAGGILENFGQVVSDASNLLVTGTYQHNVNGGTVPTATWNAGSTVELIGILSAKPAGLGQTFYNVIWNSPQTGTISLLGELGNITNDFTISNTGSRPYPLILSTSQSFTMGVGGDVLIQNSAVLGLTQSGTVTINIAGDLTVNSTAGNSLLFTSTGTGIVTVAGNFVKSGAGSVNLAAGAGSGTLALSGNFSMTAGSLIKPGAGTGMIVFERSGLQVFSNAGTFSNAIGFTVNSGSTVDFGTSSVGGTGSFTCSGAVLLGSTNPSGAVQGNIPLPSRTFNLGSSIYYNGLSAQFIGTDHPSAAGVSTVVNNASGLSLYSNAVIGGNLTLASGNISVGDHSLTLGGNVTANGNTINVGTSSSIVINGTGAFGTFPFPSGAQTFKDFTLNRASGGSVTFGSDITLTGAVTLSDGNLIFSNRTLTLNGTFSAINGGLYGNSMSTLTINGSGAFGTLRFATGGNTIHTLNFNRVTSGTGSINTSLTLLNALNLNNGDFTNTSGLALANGAIVTRASTSKLLGSNIITGTGDYYSVVYTGGAMTTGSELPTVLDDNLLNLTINGGPVTLTTNIIVNGNVTLQSGTLEASTYDITLASATGVWARQTGTTFIPGTGTVYVAGATTIQGTSARFGNLTVSNGGTLTANALLNVEGNLFIDAGSTFNHSNGVINFDGSGTQQFGGGGKNYYSLRVNKSLGALQMTSGVNLINSLDVITATEVQSNGSLVLISTSDGASGNARISSLPSGASITGNVTVQRYMSSEGRIYRYYSSPVSGARVVDLQDDFPITGSFTGSSTGCSGCTSNPSMFYYDEQQTAVPDAGYIAFPATSNTEFLTVGLGYTPFIRQNILPGPVTIDVAGTVNQGSISLPVTYTSTGDASLDGYNLVGNPYPSTIDWDNAGWSKNGLSNTIAVRDNGSGGTYQYWNGTSGGLTNGLIAAGQGFWVQAMGPGPSLQINEAAKSNSTGTFYRARPDKVNVLEMSVSNGNITDKAFLQVSRNSGEGFDKYDARKLDNVNFDFSILSKSGLDLAIHATNKIPGKNESIRLRIKDFAKGAYTFTLSKSGDLMNYDYYLLDRFTKETIDLQNTPVYAFSVTEEEASFAADRFEIFLSGTVNGTDRRSSGNDELSSSTRVFPNPSSGEVQVITANSVKSVMLLNSLGHILESVSGIDISSEQYETSFDLTSRPNGIYMVHIIDLEGRISVHKILKE